MKINAAGAFKPLYILPSWLIMGPFSGPQRRMESTMTIKLEVPEDRLGLFQRMKRQLPLEIREDPEVLQKLLIYLKLGGERLVRQVVATLKVEFPEDTQLFKHRLVEEPLETGDDNGDTEDQTSSDDGAADDAAPDEEGDENEE
jgi:hypothetical protein